MKKHLLAALLALGAAGSAGAMYLPVGPATNVALSTVTSGGWIQCYAAPMTTFIGSGAELVLDACQGDFLMMAGRAAGSDTFLVLAAAGRADTIVDMGPTSDTHLANGTNWYFSPDWAWGFTAAGDSVSNDQCDTGDSPFSMCLHTANNAGGYRINNIIDLNRSSAYEKVFFVPGEEAQVPEPASILLLGLGLLSIAAARKRKA